MNTHHLLVNEQLNSFTAQDYIIHSPDKITKVSAKQHICVTFP